jgi:cell division septation protein DedD
MVGYYQSSSSYEYIMQQTAAEGNKGDNKKVAIFEVNAKDNTSKKSPRPLAEKPTGKQLHPAELYGVQVASFKKKVDADRLRDRLRRKNYKAFVNIADLGKKGIWYRVRVGRFQRRKTAENLARALTKREKLKALVIKQ